MLFFNGDMVHGYGNAPVDDTASRDSSPTFTSTAPASAADSVNSDGLNFHKQHAFWRGFMASMMGSATYVFPVAGNHEAQCKTCARKVQIEHENAWAANMGDQVFDAARFTSILGAPAQNVAFGPAAGSSPDDLATDQSKLSYSFDFKRMHFAVVNTDAVGNGAHAPTQWLAADLAAASARGTRKSFVFGHKMAYFYGDGADPTTSAGGLDAAPGTITARDAFWDVIESNNATYFSGHEHTFSISQPRGGAYQVSVGAKSTDATVDSAPDHEYTWATVRVHQDGGVDILAYGFDAQFGATHLLQQIYLPQTAGKRRPR